jgi:hypothetical protein
MICKFRRRRKDSFLAKPKGGWWEIALRPCIGQFKVHADVSVSRAECERQ